MTAFAKPPGRRQAEQLTQQLEEIRSTVDSLRGESHAINDAALRSTAETLVDTLSSVLDLHAGDPKPSVADDLAALLSSVRGLRLSWDPDLGTTPTLELMRKSKGLLIAALIDALDAAQALGIHPIQSPFPEELGGIVSRGETDALLSGIVKRLDNLEASLTSLDSRVSSSPDFQQPRDLTSYYIGSMRVEIGLARLELTTGEFTVDFGALARVAETMAGLTGDFFATIMSWRGRISDQVGKAVVEARWRVTRVVAGVKYALKWIRRQAVLESGDPSASEEPAAPIASGEIHSIGLLLCRLREKHGLTVSDCAAMLRFRNSYVRAIEKSDYRSLPMGEAYTVGFVRAYAEFLGLNGIDAQTCIKFELGYKSAEGGAAFDRLLDAFPRAKPITRKLPTLPRKLLY